VEGATQAQHTRGHGAVEGAGAHDQLTRVAPVREREPQLGPTPLDTNGPRVGEAVGLNAQESARAGLDQPLVDQAGCQDLDADGALGVDALGGPADGANPCGPGMFQDDGCAAPCG
ncbi:MAG: hypothetical protein ACK559_17720, partial [bacterium]